MTAPTPLQMLALMNASNETNARANEFAQMAKFVLSCGISKAAFAIEKQGSKVGGLGPKLASILTAGRAGEISREALLREKAAATAGTLSSLSDYSTIATAFTNSLVNASAFDSMLASMVPTLVRTATVGAISVGATAYSVGESSAKQISKLTLTNQQQTPQKGTLHCRRHARIGTCTGSTGNRTDRSRVKKFRRGCDRHAIHRGIDRRTFCRNIRRTDSGSGQK